MKNALVTRMLALVGVMVLVVLAEACSGSARTEKYRAACETYCNCVAQGGSLIDHDGCVAGCTSQDPSSAYGFSANPPAVTDACLDCVGGATCDRLNSCQPLCD